MSEFFLGGKTIEGFPEELSGFMSSDEFNKALFLLLDKKFLLTSGIDLSGKFSRQDLFFASIGYKNHDISEKLSGKHVCLVGAGGIGNQVSCALASSGVGRVTLIDGDHVEESNLTRQFLFSKDDLGKLKVLALKEALFKRHPETVVDAVPHYLHSMDMIPPCDLLFIGADKPYNLWISITDHCLRHMIPYIGAGYIGDISVAGPLVVPGKTGCIFCQGNIVSENDIMSEREREIIPYIKKIDSFFQVASLYSLNAIAAGYATLDSIKFLLGMEECLTFNRRIGFHTSKPEVEFVECMLDKECPRCRHLQQK